MCLSFAPPLGSNPGPLLFYKPFSSEKANPIRIPSIEKWYHLNQWRIQGGARGARPPTPLRFFFGDRPPPPPPPFLKVWIRHCLEHYTSLIDKNKLLKRKVFLSFSCNF